MVKKFSQAIPNLTYVPERDVSCVSTKTHTPRLFVSGILSGIDQNIFTSLRVWQKPHRTERDRHLTKRDLRRSRQMVCFYVTFMQGVDAGSTVLLYLIGHISWKREKVNISLDVDRLSWVSQDETIFWLLLFETGPQICSSRDCLEKRDILRKKGLHYSFIPTDVTLSGRGISRRFHGDI